MKTKVIGASISVEPTSVQLVAIARELAHKPWVKLTEADQLHYLSGARTRFFKRPAVVFGYLELGADGWVLYDRHEDSSIVMRREEVDRARFKLVAPDGTVSDYVPIPDTTSPINRLRKMVGYALRQIREVWEAKTTYERVHKDWSEEQLQAALALMATEGILVTRLYESASSDGYRSNGDGAFFDSRDAAVAHAHAKHKAYATEPLQHNAINDGRGNYYLLKCPDPITLSNSEEAREALRKVALAKLSDEEKAVLNIR